MSATIKTFLHFYISIAIFVGFFAIVHGQTANILQIAPADKKMDFLIDWSTDVYVPPEYTGKPLPSYGSTITLSATSLLPINEAEYNYAWTIDLAASPNNNGSPVADFVTTKVANSEHSIYLQITNKNTGNVVKEGAIRIPVVAPQSIIYQESSAGALLPLNFNNSVQPGNTLNLIAHLFSFNKIRDSRVLRYSWALGNKKITGFASRQDQLSIEFPAEISVGTAYNLSLATENPFDPFQFAQKNYKIVVQ